MNGRHDDRGPNGRDDDIGAHLDDLGTPPHGETFWEDLRAGIARTPSVGRSTTGGDDGDAESSTRVVPLGQPFPEAAYGRRRARRARRVLAAAAVLVVVAVAAAVAVVVVEDDSPDEAITAGPEPTADPTPGPTTDPTPAPTPSTTVDPDDESPDAGGETFVDWTSVAEANVVGSGRLVAASPDGRWLYVADVDPDGGLGCEGAERRTLFVVDVETGDRRLADAGLSDATGGIEIVADSGGRVAVLEQCEGFATRLAVATIGSNGALTAPAEFSVAAYGDFVSDIAWATDGSLLVASVTSESADGEPSDQRLLFRVDPSTGQSTEVLGEDVVVFAERADGAVIAATTNGVRIPDARVIDRETPFAISISPDGSLAALQGPDVVEIVDASTGEVVSATASDGDAGSSGVWTSDGTYLATFIQLDTVTSREIVAIDPTGAREPVAVAGGLDFAEIAVIGDATIAYSKWVDDLGNSETYVVTFERRGVESPDPEDEVVASSLDGIADATLPTQLIPEGEVTLTDGAFFRGAPGDAQFAEVALRTPISVADVDDDGVDDAVVVLDAGFGGTAIVSEMIVLLARDGGFVVGSAPIRLGEDIRDLVVLDPAEDPVAHGPGATVSYDTRTDAAPSLEFDIRRTLVLEADTDGTVTVTDGTVTVADTIDEPIDG